jgi:hypothetical protein
MLLQVLFDLLIFHQAESRDGWMTTVMISRMASCDVYHCLSLIISAIFELGTSTSCDER